MKEVIDASEEEKSELQGALDRMTETNSKARQDMKGVEGGMQAKCDELVQKYVLTYIMYMVLNIC